MHTLDTTERARRKRKGQTLAEFALTLPILLILMFGIVEFARIFQAWVTLQNAARAAARYASVGQYDEARYPMILEFNTLVGFSDPDGFIPCVDDGPEAIRTWTGAPDERGTKRDYYPNNSLNPNDLITVYDNGLESLFATWYQGKNCDPREPRDQDQRKDIARILSIMDEARRGAAGLLLEESHLTLPPDPTHVDGWPFFEVWKRPLERSDQRSWFNVMVCSSRGKLDGDFSNNYFMRQADGGVPIEAESRFVTYNGEDTLIRTSDNQVIADPPTPACFLNEMPSAESMNAGGLNNAGKPWLDAGGPGDTVTVVITFNHPLITPLGLTNYITMQARRSAIVESFRAAQAANVLQGGGNPSTAIPTKTPLPTLTPTETFTASPTATLTLPASVTPTETTVPPFDCGLLSAGNLRVQSSQVFFDIDNANAKPTVMTRLIFGWAKIPAFPNMHVYEMAFDGNPFWRGTDYDPTTDTNADPSNPPNYFIGTDPADRTVGGTDSSTIASKFTNGPGNLLTYLGLYDFANTQIYLENPDDGSICVIPIEVPPPPIIPTDDPNAPTDTPTFTPDCASDLMTVRFSRFENFGVVRMEVVNNRYAVGPWTGFEIAWRKWSSSITLARVTAGAPYGQPGSVTVWESGSPLQDANPPTTSASEGNWVQTFVFDARSITPIYLDFDGIATSLTTVGAGPADFNGSWFEIGCGAEDTGGGGGGGTPPTGRIPFAEAPTPRPTNTTGPTNTPRPTFTPSKTFTPAPPTNTPTIGPSRTPTNTQPPTPTYTPTTPPPPPTIPGGGCNDGC